MIAYCKRQSVFLALGILAMTGWLAVQAANYGLNIGINIYDPAYGADKLDACVNDAVGIRNGLLADTSKWQAGTLSLVTDGIATKANVRSLLQQLAATAVSGDVVLYNQSSHGGQNSGTSVYLCMHDANYEDTELAADLAQFQTGVTIILIIDTCHSGGLFKGPDGNLTWPFAESVMRHYNEIVRTKGITRAPGIGWMTACDYNQLSQENSQNGIFSGHVIQGLTSADANADGRITFGELFDYAYPRTIADNPEQTPQTFNRSTLDATIAKGSAPAPTQTAANAYVNAYYGKLYITSASSSDAHGFLTAARSYADYAYLYAYYAYVYDTTYGSDYGYASHACQCAYYANLYASYANAYETGDVYSYNAAGCEYYAYLYSYLLATGQR